MGKFKYEGLDTSGAKVSGAIEADNEKDVRKFLRANNIRPRAITPPSILEFDINEWLIEKGLGGGVPVKTLAIFTKQLSIMISAGVPILQSLEILQKAEKNIVLRRAVRQIGVDVGEGKTIAAAMESQKPFNKLYCNLVKAGEAGGILDEILVKLSTHMEKQEKTKRQIKSALTYPTVVVVVGILVIWVLMVFVVPQFTSMLTESGQEIPWITQFVVDASNFFAKYTIVMVPAMILGFIVFRAYVNTPEGKKSWDKFTMQLPLFGDIIIKGNLSAFSNTLGTLLSAGVSLVDSLEICIETIDSTVISDDIKVVKKKIMEGQTLAEPLSNIKYMPELVNQMIKVGEQTGQIDQMLERVALVFQDDVDNLIENMTKLIEPLIIVVLGGIVATILVAMYLPMFMQAG